MRQAILVFVLVAFVLVALIFSGQHATAQNVSPTPQPGVEEIGPGGSRLSLPGQPSGPNALSSKLLSNPYCYQPSPTQDRCLINIRYYQASDNGTTPPFMLGVNISINGKLRVRENLFFEDYIYFSNDLIPGGLEVPCGAPNAGGAGAAYGNQYLVKVEPMDSSGLGMGFDQASLSCPAFAP